ncbi:MAG: GNAT family N-acetyltransferase [Burkholderiaceae bacterium]
MESKENEAQTDESRRFYLKDEEATIGFIEYYAFAHVAIVTHTEVNPALEGKGHGTELARQAVAYFQSEGKQLVPICGFFAHFLRKHPEYADTVTPASRHIFNI